MWGSDRLSPLCSIQGARPRLGFPHGEANSNTFNVNLLQIFRGVLRILAVLEMWLVPLGSAQLCHARLCHARLSLSVPPHRTAPGCATAAPSAHRALGSWQLERCTNGPDRAFCGAVLPQNTAPIPLWGCSGLRNGQKTLQPCLGLAQPCVSP